MKRFTITLSAALACAALGGLADPATAAVLFSDTFRRTTGSGDGNGDPNGADPNFSDWGTNDNALGGTNTQAWIAGPNRAGGGRNAVTNGSQGIAHGTSSFYDFDAAAAAPDGFTVALDFARAVTPPVDNGYIAIGLGVDAGTVMANDFHAIGNADWSILFQQANQGNAANAQVAVDNVIAENFDYLTPNDPHTLLLKVTPAVSGAYGDTDSITVDVLVDGSIAKNYVITGGADFGSLTVSANNFSTRYIDNLVVSAIPEPTALLLGAFALVGLAVRRRV